MPCRVSSSCQGCTLAKRESATRSSLIRGLYFMVQVPWLMSALRLEPSVSCERCRKWASTCFWSTSGSAGAFLRRMLAGSAPATSPTAATISASGAGGMMPRTPGVESSKIIGSSQRA